MQYPKAISELLRQRHKKLDDLAARLAERDAVLAAVKAELPAALAVHVASAGIDRGCLSVGVTSAGFATRLRYAIAGLRPRLAEALGVEIGSARVRIVRPAPPR